MMKLMTFAAAAAIALGGLTAAPALAQPPGHDMHDNMRNDNGRHDDNGRHEGWDRGHHNGWNNHHRRQVCSWVGHRHRHRVCEWRRW
jgi:hypothetical protein